MEFLSPRTLDTDEQVYLIGYVFEKDSCDLNWKDACHRLQMGGERGYGWGDLQCVEVKLEHHNLFEGKVHFKGDGDRPIVEQTEHLLAHALSTDLSATGEIEPMVGREWRSNNPTNRFAGQHVEKFCDPCWITGSTVEQSQNFVIQDFGIWTSLS